MKRSVAIVFLIPFLVHSSAAQDALDVERILENVRYEIPQFRGIPLDLRGLEETEFSGVFSGQLVVTGGKPYPVLIAGSDLFIIAAGPIDISRLPSELARLAEAEEQALEEQARERSVELDRFAVGMPARGNLDAAVTVYEFSDFQCPYCARGFTTIEELLEKRGQDIRFVYLHLPLQMHEWAKPAAIASTCAGFQDANAFWKLHDSYFLNQDAITLDNLLERSQEYLADSGINVDRWTACASDEASAAYGGARAQVDASIELASKYGITGTPSFFVNGRFLRGIHSVEEFDEVIDEYAVQ